MREVEYLGTFQGRSFLGFARFAVLPASAYSRLAVNQDDVEPRFDDFALQALGIATRQPSVPRN